MERAAGRARASVGETIALIAAALMAAQPNPLSAVAKRSCHGAVALAQPKMPTATSTAPAFVTRAIPKRRCSAGRLAAATAPITKWAVTAVETRAKGQPRVAWIACRTIGGPKKPMPQPKTARTNAPATTRQPKKVPVRASVMIAMPRNLGADGQSCYGGARSTLAPASLSIGGRRKDFAMASNARFAEVASLAGDPARAAMLHALMDGLALTATELAHAASVAPPTARGHP